MKKSIIKSTLQITFFSIIIIIISFVSQLIIAYYFGTKFERDAYFVAITIPTYIASVFGGSFGLIFIPKVVDILERKDPQALSEFISSTFSLLLVVLIFIVIFCVIFSHKIAQLFAPGYNSEELFITAKILVIVLPTLIFTVLSNLLGSLYQIQHKFLLPAITPILSVIISLLCVIILSEKIGISGLAYGSLAGSFISFIALLPVLKKYKFNFNIDFRNIDIISYTKIVIPLLLSGVIFRSTNVIERMIASNLPQGSISYLGYSNQIRLLLGSLITNGIVITSYPTLSTLWSENRKIEFENFLTKTIRVILLISLPVSITVIFLGDEVIKFIFERGAFNSNSTIAVGKALSWSMGAFIFQGIGGVVMKTFYISGKTIAISVISGFEIIIYLLLSIVLTKYYSFVGLSMSLSISSMICILMSYYFINKNMVKIKFLLLLRDIIKILIVSVLSILLVYFLYNFIIGFHTLVFLTISFFIGLIVFFYLGILLGIEELLFLRDKMTFLKSRNKF